MIFQPSCVVRILAKRSLTYKQVSEKLAELGVVESEPNIRNKMSRGTFSAVFLIQCLEAIGCRSLQLLDG